MMFSSHIDIVYKNSALQDILVNLLFKSVGSQKRQKINMRVTTPQHETSGKNRICFVKT